MATTRLGDIAYGWTAPLVYDTVIEAGSHIAIEKDPNGKRADEPGSKLDAGKSCVWRGLFDYFPRACLAVSDVSTVGAKKYTWKGWEKVEDGINRYGDAQARHMLAEGIEGPWDNGPKGTGCLHAAQTAWNAMARLELILREMEQTDKWKT